MNPESRAEVWSARNAVTGQRVQSQPSQLAILLPVLPRIRGSPPRNPLHMGSPPLTLTTLLPARHAQSLR